MRPSVASVPPQRSRSALIACLVLAFCGCRQRPPTNEQTQSRPPVLSGQASAQSSVPLEAERVSPELREFLLFGSDAVVHRDLIEVKGQDFSQALSVRVTAPPGPKWEHQLAGRTTQPIKKGDRLLATFYLRAAGSEPSHVQTEFAFEAADPPHTASVSYRATAATTWQKYQVRFVAEQDYAPEKAYLLFRLGFGPQQLQLAGVRVDNFGAQVPLSALPHTRLTYRGRAAGAAWRSAAEQRIERVRRAAIRVNAVDAKGNAVEGASVSLRQTAHQFGVGTAVQAGVLASDSPDGRRYWQELEQNFNTAVFANLLKWPAQHGDWGQGFSQQLADRLTNELRKRGLSVRGHTLVWPAWGHLPEHVRALKGQKAALTKAVRDHVRSTVGHFKGRISQWDVVNEPVSSRDLVEELGRDELAHWFRLARQADPAARLFINDYGILADGDGHSGHRNSFATIIEELKQRGAPLDGIGMQSHFSGVLTSPEALLEVLDRFATYKTPIWVTEYDFANEDETLAADYMRDFLTAVFSHPSVEGIVVWGLWRGEHPDSKSPLYQKNWTLRSSGKVFLEFFGKRWRTEAKGQTNAAGEFSSRGFLGSYAIELSKGSARAEQHVKLESGGTEVTLVLR